MSALRETRELHDLPTGTREGIVYPFLQTYDPNSLREYFNFLCGGYAPRAGRFGANTQSSDVWSTQNRRLCEYRSSLKQRVSSLPVKAGREGWDGEGAAKLETETVRVAQELVDRFPLHVMYGDAPDVDVTPHGEVDFDWVVDRNRMLTVSVLPSKEIAFSGLFRGARVNGREPWQGVLPQFVNCCFERLGKPEST